MEYNPGTSLSNEDRNKIINQCLLLLKDDRFVNIKFAAQHFLKMEIEYLDDAVIIACRISENSKYNWAFSQKDEWPYLFVNPSHELNEITKTTSIVQRSALKITIGIGIVTLIVTGINTCLTLRYQKKQLDIQERQQHLRPPPIIIDSVIVHQSSTDTTK
jgi:hypothetical protein